MESISTSKSMSSTEFGKHILCVKDLYEATIRNGYYLPMKSSSAVNEVMLVNVLKGSYWCPKTEEIKIKNCVRAPIKQTLYNTIQKVCAKKKLNIAWMDELHVPDKKWMVDVIATLDPENEIFKKDYVALPIRKRLNDIDTIVLPNEIFESLPLT